MLIINAEQWTQLEAQRREGFLPQLTADFISRFVKPDEVVGFDNVKAELAQVIALGDDLRAARLLALYQHALPARPAGR